MFINVLTIQAHATCALDWCFNFYDGFIAVRGEILLTFSQVDAKVKSQ